MNINYSIPDDLQRIEWCEEHESRFKDGPGGNPGLGRCDVAEIWKLADDEVKTMCRPVSKVLLKPDSWRLRSDFDVLPKNENDEPDYEAAKDMIEGMTNIAWDKDAVQLIVDAAWRPTE